MRSRMSSGGGRGIPQAVLQDANEDLTQKAVEIGIVRADKGESHFAIDDGDVFVEVALMPSEQQMTARLGSVAGGPGNGVWMVPPVGAEVVVAIPGGDPAAGGIISASLSNAQIPAGVAEGQLVIVAPEVLVYAVTKANAKELALKSDVQGVKDKYDGHIHDDPASGVTGGPNNGLTPSVIPSPTGTIVLKGE